MEMKKYKLGDLIDVSRGKSLAGEFYATSGNLVRLTMGNLDYINNCFKQNTSKDNLFFSGKVEEKFILNAGDIITPLTEQTPGLLGSTARIPESGKYIQSQDVALVRCKKDKLDDGFAYYLISSESVKKQLGAAAQQTKIRHTSPDKIKDCTVYIPEISTQKKIGSILSTLDQRIENLRAQNRVLEQTAKTIYDYTFLQCAGHQTTYNKTLNRNIPVGWEVSTIGCYIKESKGGDWGKENPEKKYNLQVSCIRGADIEKMTDLPIRYILAKNSLKLLQEFDLVVEISGGSPTQSTGRSRLMTKELLEMFDNKLICSNFCQAVTMKNPQYAYYISFMWKMFYDNGIFFNFEGKTSGIKNFQLDQFLDTMWFFPDLKTVEKFNAQVAPLIKKQLFNAKQIETLTTQRNTLLPLLMTGQIEV